MHAWFLIALLLLISACTQHEVYPPAVPAARMPWPHDVPFIPNTPPPPVAVPPPVPARPSVIPSPQEWEQWRAAPVMQETCAGRGKRRRCTKRVAGTVEQANAGALVRPTRRHTAGHQSAMVRYPYQLGQKIYEVQLSVTSPTFLLLPPGERLASTVKVDPERWDVTHVQMGQEDSRQETVVLRALYAPQDAYTALLFQSGLVIFLKLVGAEQGMLSVTWDLPELPQAPPAPPIEQRPPAIDMGRIHLAYRLEDDPKGGTPPWLPRTVFDDGTRTFVQLPPLQGQRLPAVFAKSQTGETVLTQSRLYTQAAKPEAGAWLLVQGLHPALELKDATGLRVTLVRQPPHHPRPGRPAWTVTAGCSQACSSPWRPRPTRRP